MRMYHQKQVEQLRKAVSRRNKALPGLMDEAGMPPGLQGTVALSMMPDRFTCIGRMGGAWPLFQVWILFIG